MKNIKHIREAYTNNILFEKEEVESDRLTKLIRAGMFDVKKLTFLKRALKKDISKLTQADRKVLLELLETLIDEVVNSPNVYSKVRQNVMTREEYDVIDEASKPDYFVKTDPRFKKNPKILPAIIILKRKAMRVYPDNQIIGLYYSQQLDKYISVPFETSERSFNVGLSEATKDASDDSKKKKPVPEIEHKRQALQKKLDAQKQLVTDVETGVRHMDDIGSKGRKIVTKDTLKQVGRGFASGDTYAALGGLGAVIGSKIRSAVKGNKPAVSVNKKQSPSTPAPETKPSTPAPETKKSASVPGWGKAARRDPAKTRAAAITIEETKNLARSKFYAKLEKKRIANEGINDDIDDNTISSIAKDLTPGLGTYRAAKRTSREWKKGNYGTAALHGLDTAVSGVSDAALAVPVVGWAASGALKGARGLAKGVAGAKFLSGSSKAAKAAKGVDAAGDAAKAAKGVDAAGDAAKAAKGTSRASKVMTGVGRGLVKGAKLAGLAGLGLAAAAGGAGAGEDNKYQSTEIGSKLKTKISRPTAVDTTTSRQKQDATMNRRYMQSMKEDSTIIKDLRNIIKEDTKNTEKLNIRGEKITINNTIAEKVIGLYDSLNRDNKKKMLNMMNESVESFKKVVNFAVRQ